MMYRIVINPTTSNWEVQLSGYFMFWRTLRPLQDGSEKTFTTFDEAEAFVKERGIDRVYDYSGPPIKVTLAVA